MSNSIEKIGSSHVQLLTGARKIHPDFERVRRVGTTKKIQILLQLARQDGGDDWINKTIDTISAAKEKGQIICVTQATWDANASASSEAVAGVHAFARRRPYSVISIDTSMCQAVIEGRHCDITKDFGADLQVVREKTRPHIHAIQRIGAAPILPPELAGLVKGVHMSTTPAARAHFQILHRSNNGIAATQFQGFTPLDTAKIYHGVGGDASNVTVAIGELGGGALQSDYDRFCKSIGVPTTKLKIFLVDGGKNTPMGLNGAGGEVYLDICCVAGLKNVMLGFGPNTSASIAHQTTTAVRNGAKFVSWSWGMYGPGWSAADRSLVGTSIDYATCMGAVVAFAQGDTGPVDGNPSGQPSTDFGGEYPRAWSGGGTLRNGGTDPSGTDEYWNEDLDQSAGGYGESVDYPAPSYQSALGKKGRWCPDGSITADPKSGFRVFGGGQTAVIGGTSDIPNFVAEVARVSDKLGQPIGFIQPWLYKYNAQDKLMTPVLTDSGAVDERCGLGTPLYANWLSSLERLVASAKNLPVPAGFVLAKF